MWSGWDLAEWLERLTAKAKVATILGSIPSSSDTVESKGRQTKQCWIQYIEKKLVFYWIFIIWPELLKTWPGLLIEGSQAESCLEFLPIPQIAYFIGYYPLCIYTNSPFTASHKLSTTNAHFLLNCYVYSAEYLSPGLKYIYLHSNNMYIYFSLRIFLFFFV